MRHVSRKRKNQIDFDTYAHYLQSELNTCKIHFHLLEVDSVANTLETLDTKFSYDVLAMVRREKTFLAKFFMKSFTKNMAYLTNKPLLVIPEKVLY